MLCDKCGKREATVHFQQVVNGQSMEQHLCGQCASGFGGFGTLDLNKLFSYGVSPDLKRATCPICGMSIADFEATGRLGCGGCYQAFADALRPVIRRYHGDRRHKGKIKRPLKFVPGSGELLSPPDGKLADKTYEKLALQKQLAELVELEKFEEAAKVRDRLRAVEAELVADSAVGGGSDKKAGGAR